MVMLGSCAKTLPPPPAPHPVAALPVLPSWHPPPPHRHFPVPARKPAPPVSDQPAADAADPTLAMAGPEAGMHLPTAVAPAPPARQLIGLDQGAATRLFGAANAKYAAPPATVWRYRNAACELDLFFYLDLRSGKMRTLHYAFKGELAEPGQRQDCLRSLVVAGGG
jgi:hypothetical protein